MIEDVGLNSFVFSPCRSGGEAVDFDWQTLAVGGELTYEQCHAILMNHGVVLQVGFNVGTERAYIGQSSSIDSVFIARDRVFLVPGGDVLFLFLQMFADVFDFAKTLHQRV